MYYTQQQIEIVYVVAPRITVERCVDFMPGMRVCDALQSSGLWELYPETQHLSVGIFAKRVALDHLVRPGDRLEIYRALIADPKEKRRQRAKLS